MLLIKKHLCSIFQIVLHIFQGHNLQEAWARQWHGIFPFILLDMPYSVSDTIFGAFVVYLHRIHVQYG